MKNQEDAMPASGAVGASSSQQIPGSSQSSASKNRIVDLRIGNKYRLTRKIGSGSFGEIYLGGSPDPFVFCPLISDSLHCSHYSSSRLKV
jgi:hypothetical protein